MQTALEIIQSYGLNEKQSKVYFANREIGNAPASTIAYRSGLPRVNCYLILKELMEMGTISKSLKNGVQYFSALSPETLCQNLEERASQFRSQLPDLLRAQLGGQLQSKIQFYEGWDGIKRLYMDMLDSQAPIDSFTSVTSYRHDLLDTIYKEFTPQRVKKKIFARRIMPNIAQNQEYAKKDKKLMRKTLLADGFEGFNIDVDMYGPNKVAIFVIHGNNLQGALFHSQEIYNSMSSLFNLVRGLLEKEFR